MVRVQTVQVATDQIGPSLFKNAVRSGDAALVESVARMLGDAVSGFLRSRVRVIHPASWFRPPGGPSDWRASILGGGVIANLKVS